MNENQLEASYVFTVLTFSHFICKHGHLSCQQLPRTRMPTNLTDTTHKTTKGAPTLSSLIASTLYAHATLTMPLSHTCSAGPPLQGTDERRSHCPKSLLIKTRHQRLAVKASRPAHPRLAPQSRSPNEKARSGKLRLISLVQQLENIGAKEHTAGHSLPRPLPSLPLPILPLKPGATATAAKHI